MPRPHYHKVLPFVHNGGDRTYLHHTLHAYWKTEGPADSAADRVDLPTRAAIQSVPSCVRERLACIPAQRRDDFESSIVSKGLVCVLIHNGLRSWRHALKHCHPSSPKWPPSGNKPTYWIKGITHVYLLPPPKNCYTELRKFYFPNMPMMVHAM